MAENRDIEAYLKSLISGHWAQNSGGRHIHAVMRGKTYLLAFTYLIWLNIYSNIDILRH